MTGKEGKGSKVKKRKGNEGKGKERKGEEKEGRGRKGGKVVTCRGVSEGDTK